MKQSDQGADWTYVPSCPCRRCEQHRADNGMTVTAYPYGLSEDNDAKHWRLR